MSQEYEFLEYMEQLECIKEDLELYQGDPTPCQQLIALDNTVTALESTRYPGNCKLLEIRKEIRKLLAKE